MYSDVSVGDLLGSDFARVGSTLLLEVSCISDKHQHGVSMTDKIQIGDLLTVASILSGFGVTALMFRVQREVAIREANVDPMWMAWSDYLALGSILLSVGCVVLPVLIWDARAITFAKASCAAASVAMAGFPLAILSHYRLLFGGEREADELPFERGEPAERVLVLCAAILGVLLFAIILWRG